MRNLPRTLSVLAVGAVLATLVASPASAVPTVDLNPPKLPRGGDVTIAHLEGRTVVDGAVRIPVKAPTVRLLGTSGTAYVVATANKMGGGGKIVRLEADGSATKVTKANAYTTELAGDGQTVVSVRVPNNAKSIVSVWSATTGDLVARHAFEGYVSIVDAEGTSVLVSGFDARGTELWDTSTDEVRLVTGRPSSQADLSLDLMASFTKDPYSGGCTVLSSISKPGKRLWTSCTDGIVAFSSDGSRMAVVDILSDGIGPSAVKVRTITGKEIGSYTIAKGWFGEIVFESAKALLLETNGPRKAATVRCVLSSCERASELASTVQPRIAA